MAKSPIGPFVLAVLLFALGSAIAGLLLWRSYDDVPARMWILVLAVGLLSLLVGSIVRAGRLVPTLAIVLAAFVPVVGVLLVLGVGALARNAGVTARLPVEPWTLGVVLAPWLPLWAVLAAFGAWLARRRAIVVHETDNVVVER